MAELFPPTKDELLACVQREINMRERVYPGWVLSGKMSKAGAEKQIALMKAVLAKLQEMP
jgi:hypothetical protein